MPNKNPVVLAVTSDHHCGSTLGLCPPDGVALDDGGRYLPTKVQRWLWECWTDYWSKIDALRKELKADLFVLLNGDLVDGDHHGTSQIVSRHPEAQATIALDTLAVPRALKPKSLFIVRGTGSHTGPSSSVEESLAKSMGAERQPETGHAAWWHLRLRFHGTLIDAQHHGRMGQRPWTQPNVVANLAAQIFYEHARRGREHPALAIRSHYHKHVDTYGSHPVRVVQTPAWQVKTAYVHKVAPESIADVGGIAVVVHPDRWEVRDFLYPPEEMEPWQPK